MINKAVFVMGAVLALLAFGGIFFLGQVIAPAPVQVIAAREDLAAGTALADIPDSSLVQVPLRGDAILLSSMVTQEEYARLREDGAVLVDDILAREPLRKAALVSAENDLAGRIPSRGLADPNWMIVRLAVGDSAPVVREGDLIDLGLAVTDLGTPPQITGMLSAPPVNTSSLFLMPQRTREADEPTPTPSPSPTPTLTPTPAFLAPVAKTIVHAAVVTNVVREAPIGNSEPSMRTEERAIVAIDVIIPREAFEMVTMAAAAGKLQVGLLSPLADRSQGPTLGASLSDFIDWFYTDRERLGAKDGEAALRASTPNPTATNQPAAATAAP